MTWLSDAAVARLQRLAAAPDIVTDVTAPDNVGGSADRYELLEEIGRGGMGVVYRAYDRAVEREVALKVTPAGALDVDHHRLLREARTVGNLEHPGLVPVYDAGRLPDGRGYCAMKLVRGSRFDDHLRRVTALGERLLLFLRICEPVAFAHAHGVVHRDLKPANIMVGPFGEVLVLDWGIAKVSRVPDNQSNNQLDEHQGVAVGTYGYMAPEQRRGDVDHVDARTDVYALGVLLRDLLSGASATGRQRRVVHAIAAHATAEQPADRYQDCNALIADTMGALTDSSVAVYREPLIERAGRMLAKHRAALMVVGAYLLARLLLLATRPR